MRSVGVSPYVDSRESREQTLRENRQFQHKHLFIIKVINMYPNDLWNVSCMVQLLK